MIERFTPSAEWAPPVTMDEPLHWFVRDRGSRAAHHLDYAAPRGDRALCGHGFAEILWEGAQRPRAVCRPCQEAMPSHEASGKAAGQSPERKPCNACHRADRSAPEGAHTEERLREAFGAARGLNPRRGRAIELVCARSWIAGGITISTTVPLILTMPCVVIPSRTFSGRIRDRPRAVCARCQTTMPAHEVQVWQRAWAERGAWPSTGRGTDSTALEDAKRTHEAEVRCLTQKVENQRAEIRHLLERAEGTNGTSSNRSLSAVGLGESPALPRPAKEGPRSSGAGPTQPGYKPPRIRVVSGGLPGLGKRR